jgi:hypothetical protein
LTLPDGSIYTGAFAADNRHGNGVFHSKRAGIPPFKYEGQWAKDKRHGNGVLSFGNDFAFTGAFDSGRPLPGGKCKWSDGTELEFAPGDRMASFIGPGSNPVGWEIALLKIMNHKRAEQSQQKPPQQQQAPPQAAPAAPAPEDEENEFGFGDEDGAQANGTTGERNQDWDQVSVDGEQADK